MEFTPFTVLTYISLFLVFLLLYTLKIYNAIITKRNQVRVDYSDIDIQLKRRASLIQNLMDLVREYATHEKNTFTKVSEARAAVDTSKTAHESAKADNMLTETMRSLFAVVENYPELKASQNYKTLRDDLVSTENAIALTREEYNHSVQKYNTYIQTFPRLLVAYLFQFFEEEYFQTV